MLGQGIQTYTLSRIVDTHILHVVSWWKVTTTVYDAKQVRKQSQPSCTIAPNQIKKTSIYLL
jgi:hypothetical protein